MRGSAAVRRGHAAGGYRKKYYYYALSPLGALADAAATRLAVG